MRLEHQAPKVKVNGGACLAEMIRDEGLTLNALTRKDMPELKRMVCDILMDYGVFNLAMWYKKNRGTFESGALGGDPKRSIAHAIRDRGKIIGCGVLCNKWVRKNPEEGEITNLYVHGNYRGRGLGKAIMVDLIQAAPQLGYETLHLTTYPQLQKAINLYESLGFLPVECKNGFRDSLAFRFDLKGMLREETVMRAAA